MIDIKDFMFFPVQLTMKTTLKTIRLDLNRVMIFRGLVFTFGIFSLYKPQVY